MLTGWQIYIIIIRKEQLLINKNSQRRVSYMFTLTPGALDYIKQSGGNLIVELNFVSAGG